MADQKISAMPSATTPLTGAELVPMVQSGANVQSTLANFGAYARNTFSNYGAFEYTDGPLTAPAATVATVNLNITDYSKNVTLGSPSSRVVMGVTGTYSIIISVQVSNSSANYDDFTLWTAINGTDVANSASVIAVPAKKGSVNGRTILAVQFTYAFTAGEYIEFKWITEGGTTSIVTVPASLSTPIHPAAPGVILSVIQVA